MYSTVNHFGWAETGKSFHKQSEHWKGIRTLRTTEDEKYSEANYWGRAFQ